MSKTLLEQFDEKFPHKIAGVIDDFGDNTKSEFKRHLLKSHIDICNEEIKRLKGLKKRTYESNDDFTKGFDAGFDGFLEEEIKHHAQRRETLLEELNKLNQ